MRQWLVTNPDLTAGIQVGGILYGTLRLRANAYLPTDSAQNPAEILTYRTCDGIYQPGQQYQEFSACPYRKDDIENILLYVTRP